MARGVEQPIQRRAELIAAVLAGETLRAAAARFGVPLSSAQRWLKAHRLGMRSMPGGTDGTPSGTDGSGDPPVPTDEELDAWVMRYLGRGAKTLYAQAEMAAERGWLLEQSGAEWSATHSALGERMAAIYDARQRARAAGFGAAVEPPTQAAAPD